MEDTDVSVWLRRLKIGYGLAAVLFLVAMLTFIIAIALNSGPVAGIGGIFLVTSFVCALSIGIYHALTRDEYV